MMWASAFIFIIVLAKADTTSCVLNSRVSLSKAGCDFLQDPTPTDALVQVRGRYIAFIGESTLRQQFEQLVGLLESKPSLLVEDHKDEKIQLFRPSNAVLRFSYEPTFQEMTTWLQEPVTWFDRQPDLIVMQAGLHDLLYHFDDFQKNFDGLAAQLHKTNVPVLYQTMPTLEDEKLTAHRKEATQFRSEKIKELNNMIKTKLSNIPGLYLQDMFAPEAEAAPSTEGDGVHNMARARHEAQSLIQAFHVMRQDPEVFVIKKWTRAQIMFFFIYALTLLIVITSELGLRLFQPLYDNLKLQASSNADGESEAELVNKQQTDPQSPGKNLLGKKNTITGTHKPIHKASQGEAMSPRVVVPHTISFLQDPLDLYLQNQAGFRAAFSFTSVVFCVFLMDGPFWRPFDPALKNYSRDFFIFLHIIIFAVGYITMSNTRGNKDQVLGIQQTSEWKGTMQIIFVLYHYFDAGEIYNMIRMFISAYVWMTGFGNTMYFTNKKKANRFSWTRLIQMFFRLNWLVFWVCCVLDQPLMLYYICPLHTFFFFFTFFVCYIGNAYNDQPMFFAGKMLCAFIFLFVLFDVDGVFEVFFKPLNSVLQLYGSLHEWKFRATLDHYQTYFGIVCAFLIGPLSEFYQKAETHKIRRHVLLKALFIGPWVVASLFWVFYVFTRPKFEYNKLHPFTAFIPVITYILLRNSVQSLRRRYSGFLGWMGFITLETYVFQYHLYLQDDAKSIVVLFPGYPLVNFAILSCTYIFLSKVAFDATNGLKTWIFPNIDTKAGFQDFDNVKRALYLTSSIGGIYLISGLILSVMA